MISSPEQYQKYKDDFNSEYSEYRHLHAELEVISRHLIKLQNEFKQVKQSKIKKKVISLKDAHKSVLCVPQYLDSHYIPIIFTGSVLFISFFMSPLLR